MNVLPFAKYHHTLLCVRDGFPNSNFWNLRNIFHFIFPHSERTEESHAVSRRFSGSYIRVQDSAYSVYICVLVYTCMYVRRKVNMVATHGAHKNLHTAVHTSTDSRTDSIML